jgi:competence protein ComEC
VLHVRTRSSSLLLTGDIEAQEEADLVQRLGASLKSEVMLVPHHGSRTSSTAAWLDAVQPRMAWVQAGYRNRFGHPAADVMARYQARHIQVLETARCGAIQWSSAQPEKTVCERMKRRRYWHHVPA